MPPGEFIKFNGLWVRGHVDECPQDHFPECENVMYDQAGIRPRDGDTEFRAITGIVRMHLYKPNPPFAGDNIPRLIVLNTDGELIDLTTDVVLNTDPLWTDFALVNFFGRAYISPHDGQVGLENEVLYVYDGTTFREAGGVRPGSPLSVTASVGTGTLGIGTYLFAYAWESDTGFISQPSPFNYLDSFGQYRADLTNIALGPAGTVARWLLATKLVPDFGVPTYRANIGVGFDVSDESAQTVPLYFAHRIDDNTTLAYNLSFYDETLQETADYLWTLRETIPAGVGLMDFKGRLVTYGIFEDPSLVLASEIGEPEAHSETSGFFITDPADSTGVRSGTEFRNTLFVYKRQRGYMTQDNGDTPSTWQVDNFEKSLGTEQYGLAQVMDAKGSSSDGYIMASVGGIYYFNGIFQEPELTYKIKDLWDRIPEVYFHKMQLSLDPINKRIYALVPLDDATEISHIIVGDYREGLNPKAIKWSLTTYVDDPRSLIIYTDFSTGNPLHKTRLANTVKILDITVNEPGDDDGNSITAFVEFAPFRFGYGVSQFGPIRLRATGPAVLDFIAYGIDKTIFEVPESLTIASAIPGREYSQLMNLVSEQCRLKITCEGGNFKINAVIVEGEELWSERPR